MNSNSLIEWQNHPSNGSTRLAQSVNAFGCHNCNKTHMPNDSTEKNIIICTSGSEVSFFCISCWDGEPNWQCEHCESTPEDKDIISCDCCGQWTHNNCSQYIDIAVKYICKRCKNSDLKNLKETIYDNATVISNANDAAKKWKSKFDQVQKGDKQAVEQEKKKHSVVLVRMKEEFEQE